MSSLPTCHWVFFTPINPAKAGLLTPEQKKRLFYAACFFSLSLSPRDIANLKSVMKISSPFAADEMLLVLSVCLVFATHTGPLR